jgi:hypothetical protein
MVIARNFAPGGLYAIVRRDPCILPTRPTGKSLRTQEQLDTWTRYISDSSDYFKYHRENEKQQGERPT